MPYQQRLGAHVSKTLSMAKRKLTGGIVNGIPNGVQVVVVYDESRPGELLWELTYTEWPGGSARGYATIEALRSVLLKEDLLIPQGDMTFIVSGGTLYVGALFSRRAHLDRAHIVTSLSKEALEQFCDRLP